jgi:hypothetical protein
MFVAPQIEAQLSEALGTIGVFLRRSASETEALQTLSSACPCYRTATSNNNNNIY